MVLRAIGKLSKQALGKKFRGKTGSKGILTTGEINRYKEAFPTLDKDDILDMAVTDGWKLGVREIAKKIKVAKIVKSTRIRGVKNPTAGEFVKRQNRKLSSAEYNLKFNELQSAHPSVGNEQIEELMQEIGYRFSSGFRKF